MSPSPRSLNGFSLEEKNEKPSLPSSFFLLLVSRTQSIKNVWFTIHDVNRCIALYVVECCVAHRNRRSIHCRRSRNVVFFFFFFFFSLLLFVSMVFFRADELNAPEMNWHTQWQSAVRTSVQSKFLRTPISRSSALKKKKKITLFLQPARLARSHCGDVPSCGIRYVTLVCCEIKSLIASRRSLLSSRSKRFVSSPHDEISSLIPRSCTRLALCSFDFVAAMRHSLAPGPERCDFLICVTFFFFFFYKGFSPFFFFFFFFFFAYRNRRPRV
jgi:hypothetical protein